MGKDITIYGLADPDTGEIRYIGKTIHTLKHRLGRHIGDANRRHCNTHRSRWIRTLRKPPTIRLLMTVQSVLGSYAEIYAIAVYRSLGYSLTNATDGGEGCLGLSPSAETRAKIRASKQRQIISATQRAQISRALTGRRVPDHVRAKISKANKGRIVSADVRARTSRTLMGHSHSPETLAKISATSKGRGLGRVLSPQTRAKISAAHKGKSRPWSSARRDAYLRKKVVA